MAPVHILCEDEVADFLWNRGESIGRQVFSRIASKYGYDRAETISLLAAAGRESGESTGAQGPFDDTASNGAGDHAKNLEKEVTAFEAWKKENL